MPVQKLQSKLKCSSPKRADKAPGTSPENKKTLTPVNTQTVKWRRTKYYIQMQRGKAGGKYQLWKVKATRILKVEKGEEAKGGTMTEGRL